MPARTCAQTTLLVLAMLALAAGPAAAQSWPQRTVKLVTPQPAGTAIDTGLRIYAERLGKRWGQSVVVENRPGGEGIPATAAYIAAKDDHALFATPGYPFTIAPTVMDKLPYNPDTDATPITLMLETPLMISVHAGLAANTLADLERLAKAEPGKLNWASTAGLPNFSFNYFLRRGSLDMAYVPYRDAASALSDTGEGRVQVYVTSYGTVLPQVQAGKIRVLVMLGGARIPLAPQVPTVAEAGYGHIRVDGFGGLFGIKDMPAALRDRIAGDVRAVAADPEVQKSFSIAALVPKGTSPAEFEAILKNQRTQVGEMVKVLPKQ